MEGHTSTRHTRTSGQTRTSLWLVRIVLQSYACYRVWLKPVCVQHVGDQVVERSFRHLVARPSAKKVREWTTHIRTYHSVSQS